MWNPDWNFLIEIHLEDTFLDVEVRFSPDFAFYCKIGIENLNPDFPIERILFSLRNHALIEDTILRLLLETGPPSLQLRPLPTELVLP